MEQVTFSDLKKMSRTEILAGPCLEITADGLPLGVLVVNPISEMRTRIIGNCGLIDASLGNPPLGGFPKPELKPEPEVELEPVTQEEVKWLPLLRRQRQRSQSHVQFH